MTLSVVIDTDTGVDDALALLLAFGGGLDVKGLTIVPGANAKLVARVAGHSGIPVCLGIAPDPYLNPNARPLASVDSAVQVHGKDGLGNAAANQGQCAADFEFDARSASEFIYETCASSPGEVTIVAIGPMTNIAAAATAHTDLPELVQQVVIMGGAVHGELRGNRTPTAEANVYDNPCAFQTVLTSGFKSIVIADLGITHQTNLDSLRLACNDRLLETPAIPRFIDAVCQTYLDTYLNVFQQTHAPAHDVVPVMFLLRPDLFNKVATRVEVELEGSLTTGMTVADWGGKWGLPNNCEVLTTLTNHDEFVDEFIRAIRALSKNHQDPF